MNAPRVFLDSRVFVFASARTCTMRGRRTDRQAKGFATGRLERASKFRNNDYTEKCALSRLPIKQKNISYIMSTMYRQKCCFKIHNSTSTV